MRQYLTLLLIVFILNIADAQNPGNIAGSLLWLKAEKPKDSILKPKITTQELISSYFNYNPIVDRQALNKTFKNIVAEQYSLFVVFKSEFEEERNILTLQRGFTKVLLTNKEILNAKEMVYKGNASKGIILSYLNGNNDKNGKKRNSLIIDDLFAEDEEGKEQLMELIYFPRMLSKLERQEIETYLSIKYGISIDEKYDYLNSGAEKVWDIKENELYGNRITGIGRDDLLGLYQKQSGNSLKDGIYIGLGNIDTTNNLNNYTVKDMSFLMWGDNGGKTLFTQDKNKRLKKIDRLWKMDVSGISQQDSVTTQLKINKKEFAYITKSSDKEFLWLCINALDKEEFDYAGAKYIRQSSEDDEFIYFNDIAWDVDGSGADVFTFIQGPDFIVEHNVDYACESDSGSVVVTLIGGTLPYTLNFDGKELVIENGSVQFGDLQPGSYKLTATEFKGSSVSGEIEINPFIETSVSLSPLWFLNDQQEVTIRPTINAKPDDLKFEWKYSGKRISIEKEFIAKVPGDYVLTVSNTEGCKKDIPFKVEALSDSYSSEWKVYPNPVRSGEQFYIDFKLEKELPATVTISSMEGKQILYKNLGIIKEYIYNETITTSGVYLITITIGDTSETIKLIVH